MGDGRNRRNAFGCHCGVVRWMCEYPMVKDMIFLFQPNSRLVCWVISVIIVFLGCAPLTRLSTLSHLDCMTSTPTSYPYALKLCYFCHKTLLDSIAQPPSVLSSSSTHPHSLLSLIRHHRTNVFVLKPSFRQLEFHPSHITEWHTQKLHVNVWRKIIFGFFLLLLLLLLRLHCFTLLPPEIARFHKRNSPLCLLHLAFFQSSSFEMSIFLFSSLLFRNFTENGWSNSIRVPFDGDVDLFLFVDRMFQVYARRLSLVSVISFELIFQRIYSLWHRIMSLKFT